MGIHPLAVVHPTAVVDPSADIGSECVVGPYSVIESDVTLGERCQVSTHAVIKRGTILGTDNTIAEHCVIGGLAQHIQAKEFTGRVRIGSHNVIRETCTIHRPLRDGETVIGDHNFLMVGVHVAHDCNVGNHVIIANSTMLAGHVTVEDRAFISGGVGIHQFVRIGRQCMIGGTARIPKDVLPYVTIDGASNFVVGLNTIGLRRGGMSSADLLQLKKAYRIIYRSCLSWNEVLERLGQEFPEGPAAEFRRFCLGTKRGVIAERRLPPGATIKLSVSDETEDAGGSHTQAKAG